MKTNKISKDQKKLLYKICFFVLLLTLSAMFYLESKTLIDAVYFMVVLAIFIRFIILKLYHL